MRALSPGGDRPARIARLVAISPGALDLLLSRKSRRHEALLRSSIQTSPRNVVPQLPPLLQSAFPEPFSAQAKIALRRRLAAIRAPTLILLRRNEGGKRSPEPGFSPDLGTWPFQFTRSDPKGRPSPGGVGDPGLGFPPHTDQGREGMPADQALRTWRWVRFGAGSGLASGVARHGAAVRHGRGRPGAGAAPNVNLVASQVLVGGHIPLDYLPLSTGARATSVKVVEACRP